MVSLTLFAGAAVFLLLAAQPFLIYPATLWVARAVRGPLPGPGQAALDAPPPSFAICMAAYNEEDVILAKAANLLALAETVPNCSLHVYVDAATDRTAELLAPFRDRIDVVVGEARLGKTHGLNQLMRRVEAEIVVFTDANVELHPEALTRIAPWFADPAVGCVSGHLVYLNDDETATSAGGALYWRIEEAIRALESDVFSVIGCDGSLFAIRRSLHAEVPDDIIDDFYVSMKIVCAGRRVAREPLALAFERTSTSGGEEFRRKIRIACQAFNVHRLIWRDVRRSLPLAYCYVSHRLLKWVLIYNLGLAGAFLLAGAAAVFGPLPAFGAAAAGAGLFAALAAMGFGPARKIVAMLSALLGAGVGVWRSVRGDRFQTWTPTQTARGPIAAPELALPAATASEAQP